MVMAHVKRDWEGWHENNRFYILHKMILIFITIILSCGGKKTNALRAICVEESELSQQQQSKLMLLLLLQVSLLLQQSSAGDGG